MTQTLKAAFAALHAERERTWPAEQLRKNVETRAELVRRYDPARHAAPGDTVAPFTLYDPAGTPIHRADLLRDGPAVLIFFRYGGCPACNIALPYYDRLLSPTLAAAGIPLVAVSPQTPADATLKTRHDLSLIVAADPQNALGDALGITFEPDHKPEIKPGDSWIGSIAGTDSWGLPQPTVLILNQDATIHFIQVSPDWLDRPEADTILAALADLRVSAAA